MLAPRALSYFNSSVSPTFSKKLGMSWVFHSQSREVCGPKVSRSYCKLRTMSAAEEASMISAVWSGAQEHFFFKWTEKWLWNPFLQDNIVLIFSTMALTKNCWQTWLIEAEIFLPTTFLSLHRLSQALWALLKMATCHGWKDSTAPWERATLVSWRMN